MRSEKSTEQQKNRTRNWTFLVYPESAPKNWRDLLDEEYIAWIESPLHDKDVNATGELKKSHCHVLLMFESVKDFEQVKVFTDKLNAPMPQKCASAKALVRYMAHLDNPEKAQYDRNLIIAHGGADLEALFTPSSSQRYQYIDEMCDFIENNDIVEFNEIAMYARKKRREDWFPLLTDSCTMFIKAVITSRRHSKQPTEAVRVIKVNENGEVIE